MLDQIFTSEVLPEEPTFRSGGRWRKVGQWQRDTGDYHEEKLDLLHPHNLFRVCFPSPGHFACSHDTSDGYVPTKSWRESRCTLADGEREVVSTTSDRMNYFIRVRTVRDKEGKVVSALYGKVHGDFRWFIGTRAPKSGLAFIYYLNPDGTRNMEFDPTRNLLKTTNSDDISYRSLEP